MRFFAGLGAAALTLVIAVTAATPPRSFTGVVGDTMCGAHHQMPGASPAECTRRCVAMGDHYALIVGQRVYRLQASKAIATALDRLAGERVTLRGSLRRGAITVASVAAAH